MPAGGCSGSSFLGIARGLWAARWMLGASCPSSNVWAGMGARGPPRNERPSRRRMDARSGDETTSVKGWVGWRKNRVSVGTGPAGDGEAFPEVYSELVAAGLALCREPQVF